MDAIIILSIIGFLISAYALYTELTSKKGKKALCDLSDKVSCTKAFTSDYGKVFGFSNSALGMIFYTILIWLFVLNFRVIVFYLAAIAVIGTCYLAFMLYFKVKSYCIICSAIYLINILLLVFAIYY